MRQEAPHIRLFVVDSVVPDPVDNAFILVVCLDFGQQFYGTHAVHRARRYERFIEGFKVQRAVNVDAGTT